MIGRSYSGGPIHAIDPCAIYGAADDGRGDIHRRSLGGVRGRASLGTRSCPAGNHYGTDREAPDCAGGALNQ
jgi:hypothetical protein